MWASLLLYLMEKILKLTVAPWRFVELTQNLRSMDAMSDIRWWCSCLRGMMVSSISAAYKPQTSMTMRPRLTNSFNMLNPCLDQAFKMIQLSRVACSKLAAAILCHWGNQESLIFIGLKEEWILLKIVRFVYFLSMFLFRIRCWYRYEQVPSVFQDGWQYSLELPSQRQNWSRFFCCGVSYWSKCSWDIWQGAYRNSLRLL